MIHIHNVKNIQGQKVAIGPTKKDWKFLIPTIWHEHYQFMLTDDVNVMYVSIHRDRKAFEYSNTLYKLEHKHIKTKEAFAMFVCGVVNDIPGTYTKL